MLRHLCNQNQRQCIIAQNTIKSKTIVCPTQNENDDKFVSFLKVSLSPESYAALELHRKSMVHLVHQRTANDKGMVRDGQHHKNHTGNLVSISGCERCHK